MLFAALSRTNNRSLVCDDETSNSSRGKSRKDTRNQGRESETRNVSGASRGQLGQNTNLDTERTDVAKSAESIGGNELGARAEVGVRCVGGESMESVVLVLKQQGLFICSEKLHWCHCGAKETYGDDLLRDQARDAEKLVLVLGNTKQKCDGEQNISQNGLQSQLGVVDVQVVTPPGKKTIDEANNGNDAKQGSDNGATNLDAEPSAVSESVQKVLRLVLVIIRDHDTASSKSLFRLRVAQLGDCERGRDGHDAGRHERFLVQTETNIADKNGTRNGSETTGENLMYLGISHVCDKRSNQHGRLSLSNEGGGSSDDSFGTRHTESPEDKSGKLLDEPLDESDVVEDLDKRDEEDDGRNDTNEEPGLGSRGFVSQENDAVFGKSKQIASTVGDEAEDGVTGAGAKDEQTNNVLSQHASNDSAPVDSASVGATGPEAEEDDGHSEQTNGTVAAGVVDAFFGDKGAK